MFESCRAHQSETFELDLVTRDQESIQTFTCPENVIRREGDIQVMVIK